MNAQIHHIADLLLAIEAELRQLQLWDAQAPSIEALQSQAPFCYDTLALHQWLQWVFLPRMKEILEQGEELPARSGIAPLAEEVFQKYEQDTVQLIRLLSEFDAIFED